MRIISRIGGFILLLNSISLSVVSQVPLTAGAAGITATIIQPISYSKTVNTENGNVAIILSWIVEMTPVGAASKKGDIVLPVSSGTFTATAYAFSGATCYSYTVSVPTYPIIVKSGSNSMKVASFINNPIKNSGSDLIAGVFVSVTPSNVTVNYN